MNLEKSIQLSREAVTSLRQGKHPEHADGVQLCIEAATYLVKARFMGAHHAPALLNGETADAPSP